jgi:ubiquinone/menaquinone biosynthesis C-methylase UbiE
MGKMRMFLRQSSIGREPLAVAMSGVRMGERVLQIGMDTPTVTGLLGAKPGLSGESSIVVADDATAVQARRAIGETAALVNISVHALDDLPYDRGSFDLIVLHNRNGQLESLSATQHSRALGECRRILRSGGRVVVIDRGSPSGLRSIFRSRKDSSHLDATVRALEAAGFRAVRLLGDRDGYCFVEGMNVEATG